MRRGRPLDFQPLPLSPVTDTPCGRPPRSRTRDTGRRSSAHLRRNTTARQPDAHSGASATARLGPKRQIQPTPPRTPTPDPSPPRHLRPGHDLRAPDKHEIESDGLLLSQPHPTLVPGLNRWTPTANHRAPNPASLGDRPPSTLLNSAQNATDGTPINRNSVTWIRNRAGRFAARTAVAHPLRAHLRSFLLGLERRAPRQPRVPRGHRRREVRRLVALPSFPD